MKKPLRIVLLALGAVVAGLQFVRPAFDNPPVVREPAWDSPATRELARRACFDCHSNEAKLPWYGQVAPVRWVLVHHLKEGREHLNFSDWTGAEAGEELVEEIRSGRMPLREYLWLHAKARLTLAETDSLVAGLLRTAGSGTTDVDSRVREGLHASPDEVHEHHGHSEGGEHKHH